MNRLTESPTASWVWPVELKSGVNLYVEFKHEFNIENSFVPAELLISVDSNYAVWINGRFIDCGQYHDFPNKKIYDILKVDNVLVKGKNELRIMAYYQGEGSMQYIKGEAGLIYILKTDSQGIASGLETLWRISPCYHQGPYDKITGQLSFSFEYDASKDSASPTWTPIRPEDLTPLQDRPLAGIRPIEKVVIKNRASARIIAQGIFKRETENGKTHMSVAELMNTDFLSPREGCDLFKAPFSSSFEETGLTVKDIHNANEPNSINCENIYLVIDLGREEAGFFEMEIEAAAGTTVDIGYGEHLDHLRVHTAIGGRNFAARYICKDGRQQFTHLFKRFAGRYIQLHITAKAPYTLYYAGLLPTEYPIERKGCFESPDSIQNKIYEVAVRTLHLCMHEHYEDCPWREQALYANDSRNQALCGYYCFGEYRFPAASFDLLGQSLKDDGYLEICAPTEFDFTIPSFSIAWILELGDYYLYSGDHTFIERMWPKIQKMMDIYISSMKDGLLPSPIGKRYWHFYDWADGLDGCDASGFAKLKDVRFDAPLNLFFIHALETASILARLCGHNKTAESYLSIATEMKPAVHIAFWNAAENAYVTYIGKTNMQNHFAELVQSLAVTAGVCPTSLTENLCNRLLLKDNHLVKTTLSQSIYKYEALLGFKEKYGKQVFDQIASDWSTMLFKGATSFWETLVGGDDFGGAGSLCHGWSAVPIYFYQAYLSGIKPISPGFKTFRVDPVFTVIDKASGIVPTPFGPIHLKWQKTDNGIRYELKHPKEIKPEIINLQSKDEVIINTI